jgi:hypothetical protein
MGLVVAPIAQLTLADVAAPEAGTGSGLFNTVSQLGASIGVATIGALFFTQLNHDSTVGHLTAAAYGHAFSGTLRISAGLLVVALAVSCVLPRRTVAAPATGNQPPTERAGSAKSPANG